ncbi:fluoride efflux transporter CrcB [Ferrimonas aestuarii]|uniref:Fluoride-specific ion channel FluC n=1 Tax=Ferrimonas aestuarii TaxID=2569539 RepID=A0A4V5NZ37_9GAMM|nr:fluoride efflux transporter CrcB [Ferrimonas aestuarii]TKB53266.1 fluoride efflux transporter CrcB [Ferrimonas aestuarii]
MNNLIAVALGGAVGASARYGLSLLAIKLFGTGFPFGTLMVNCIGSLMMGALYAWGDVSDLPPALKAFVGVGMLGALTTFSTFSNETLLLMQEGDIVKAMLNVLLNVGLCLVMVYVGQQLVYARI